MQTKLDSFFAWCKTANLASPIVKITTRTKPKLLSASRAVFPEGVERLAVRIGMLGMGYENCVKNLTKNEFFEAQSLWGGKGRHTAGSRYLVEHVDKPGVYYVSFRPHEDKNGSLIVPEDQWYDAKTKEVIGKPILFLPKQNPPKTGVFWRTILVENIEKIQCGNVFDFTTCEERI